MATLAKAERLEPYSDLAMLATIGERFSLDPDEVYEKPFNFVMNFICMWKEQEAYQKRIGQAKKAIKPEDDSRNT